MKAVTKTVLSETCKNNKNMKTQTLALMTAVTLGVTGLLASAQDHDTPGPVANSAPDAPAGRPGPGPRNQRPGNRPPRSPLQAALDANGDGIISADEIANAPAALRKLDGDGDGKLTIAELAPHHPHFGAEQNQAGFNPPPPRRGPGLGGSDGMAAFAAHHFAGGPGGPGFEQRGLGGGPRRFAGPQGMGHGGPEADHFGAGGFQGRPHPPMERPENFGDDRAPFPPRPAAFHGGPGMPPPGPGFDPDHFDRPGPGPRGFGHADLNSHNDADRPDGPGPKMRPFRSESRGANHPPAGREPQTRQEGRADDFRAPHHPPGTSADGEDLPPQPASNVPPPQD